MRVLVACEFSGVVREAFRKLGHDAWSCDLLPCDLGPAYHFRGDIFQYVDRNWDLMIAHPPCTAVCVSGNRWYAGSKARYDSIEFIDRLWSAAVKANIKRIALENPIGVLSTQSFLGKPTQIIQPWQFGHGETKATCLWLRNLPALKPTKIVAGRLQRTWLESPGPDRWKRRSITYTGIAKAMAKQWGGNA